MNKFNRYMDEFKSYSLEDKKKVVLDQLKLLNSLTNEMCSELGITSDLLINSDVVVAHNNLKSEENFVEGIVVYVSSIQNQLCDFINEFSNIIENKSIN